MKALHKHPARKSCFAAFAPRAGLQQVSARAEICPVCPQGTSWAPTAVNSLSLGLCLLWDTSYSQQMIPESFVQGRNHIHRWDADRTGALFYNIPIDILSEISSLIS